MVTLGANAKGKSSSVALNRLMQKSTALSLAKSVYIAGIHCPTWPIRADDPSRQNRLRPSRLPLLFWLLALKRGDLANAQHSLDQCSGLLGPGVGLLLGQSARLAAAGGVRSVGAWSLATCYSSKPPGLGPWPSNCAKQQPSGNNVVQEELEARPLPEMARWDPIQVVALLEEFGRVMYEKGSSQRNYAETLNIVVQRFLYLKSFLAVPWKLLTTWESVWPGKVHLPMPVPLPLHWLWTG